MKTGNDMSFFKRTLLFPLGALGFLLLPTPSLAQTSATIPGTMVYEGYVEDMGTPLDGTYVVDFRIYDHPTVGALIWSDLSNNVSILDGYFTEPLTGFSPTIFDGDLYLEVEVDGTIMGRQQIHSVPYAQRAAAVDWSNVENKPERTMQWSAAGKTIVATGNGWGFVTAPNDGDWNFCSAVRNDRAACYVNGAGSVNSVIVRMPLDGIPDNITITEFGVHYDIEGPAGGTDAWECGLLRNNVALTTTWLALNGVGAGNDRLSVKSDETYVIDPVGNNESEHRNPFEMVCRILQEGDNVGGFYLHNAFIRYTEN
jgi:hypothetical protein